MPINALTDDIAITNSSTSMAASKNLFTQYSCIVFTYLHKN